MRPEPQMAPKSQQAGLIGRRADTLLQPYSSKTSGGGYTQAATSGDQFYLSSHISTTRMDGSWQLLCYYLNDQNPAIPRKAMGRSAVMVGAAISPG